jgi:radical SAM superfamily enzyme YgiQ (UPF0313 family)
VKPLIVDALAHGKGVRYSTKDVIGAGPRTIAGVLESQGLKPKIQSAEKFLSKGKESNYDSLFISGMTSDLSAIQKVVRKWRKQQKGLVLIGGPAASEPVRVLRRSGADIAVTGEGEYSLKELLDHNILNDTSQFELKDIKGITYRKGKQIFRNPLRPVAPRKVFEDFSPSIETIKDYRLFSSARVYVEAVRGCSNYHRARIGEIGERCTFCEECTQSGLSARYDCPVGIPPGCGYCSVPSLYGVPKSRSSELIIDEVSKLFEMGVHRVVLSAPGFLDYQREALVYPNPLTNPKDPEPNYDEIEKLLSGLMMLEQVEHGNASIMIENIKAGLVTEQAADILGKYLSGTSVSIGFETGSEVHSKLIGRSDTPNETLVSIQRLKEAGLKPYVYFIHGLPGQNENTVTKTVKMIDKSMKRGAERIILYKFQSLPASTFSQCPSGAPSLRNPLSNKIYKAAKKANMDRKETLVGDRVNVVIAERYYRDSRYWVAYPMFHGPVMLLSGKDFEKGAVVTAKISGIASDRMVYGEA